MYDQMIDELLPDIIKLRHSLHQCPELRYQEHETSKLISQQMEKFGFKVNSKVAKTGITAILDSGKPGKVVALRADMDALPIVEKTNLPYASKLSGMMHACGHDGHMAALLTAAGTLARLKTEFKGKIIFIFQPAEEGGLGAAEMIKEGVLDNPKVDAIFGWHNMPLPLGQIATRSGCIFSGADFLKVNVIGKGAHAAMPEKAIDPIVVGSAIVQALQTVVSRNTQASDSVVMSITEFHAGNAVNIIPGEATLTISLRTSSPAVRAMAIEKCKQIVAGIAVSFGAKATVEEITKCPPTMNTVNETKLLLKSAREVNQDVVELTAPTMATEDFSFYLERVPGCFFMVGNGNERSTLHTPDYHFNEEIISVAAKVLIQTTLNFLK